MRENSTPQSPKAEPQLPDEAVVGRGDVEENPKHVTAGGLWRVPSKMTDSSAEIAW